VPNAGKKMSHAPWINLTFQHGGRDIGKFTLSQKRRTTTDNAIGPGLVNAIIKQHPT
jgi:hypothetical protein